MVPCQKGGYLVSVGQSICHFDWDTKQIRTLCTVDEGKQTRINDGKCDASGRLWFGKIAALSLLKPIEIFGQRLKSD